MDKPKIVAVDDAPFICETLKAWLKNDYEIQTFLNGKQALEYLLEHGADLILLDYEMPNMTGYEVLMGIRTDKQIGKTPVIFLTGVTNDRMEVEMMERGASDFIRKPLDISILRQRIEKQLHAVR
jgi:response regulator RpfG family c-di-GMP phosphodiesterase